MGKNVLIGFFLIGLLFLTGCSELDRFIGLDEDVGGGRNTTEFVDVYVSDFYGDDFIVYYIDVGQGDSTLITYGDFSMLIDCGDNSRGGDVVEFLNSKNVSELDVLVATHGHADHIGGCDDVLNAVWVEKVYHNGVIKDTITYKDFIGACEAKSDCEAVKWDHVLDVGLPIEFFVAYDDGRGFFSNENDNSVVNSISYGGVTYLFMGDCEAECEELIVDDLVLEDEVVLKVGHHGSGTSSLESFINEVQPNSSIISVGEDNRYDHPVNETVQRLLGFGDVYMTKDIGTITFKEGVYYD